MRAPEVSGGTATNSKSANSPRDSRNGSSQSRWRQLGFGGYNGVLLALATIACSLAGVVALSGTARKEVALSFSRQGVTFIELFFTTEPPATVIATPAGEAVQVTFTLVNHDRVKREFPYSITLLNAGVSVSTAAGLAAVGANAALTVTSAVNIAGEQPWSAVQVDLAGRTEHLRLLRANVAGAGS